MFINNTNTVQGFNQSQPDPTVVALPTGSMPFPNSTSLDQVQANLAASALAYVDFHNRQNQSLYDAAVVFFNQNAGSGALGQNPVPPVAPFRIVYVPANGPQGFGGWDFSTVRLTPTPPLTVYTGGVNAQPNTEPNVIMIGARDGSTNWFTALKGDTFPNGKTTPTQLDGHTYEKFGAPVGPGWYLQVS
jgi:hypothetical protein